MLTLAFASKSTLRDWPKIQKTIAFAANAALPNLVKMRSRVFSTFYFRKYQDMPKELTCIENVNQDSVYSMC